MKKHTVLILFVTNLLLILAACQEHPAKSPLTDAEACIDCHPDSSLMWLQSLTDDELDKEQRAYRALLLTHLSHKLECPSLYGDSLINEAVNFYDVENYPKQRARALFFQGIRRASYEGNEREAVTSLLKAEKIFKQIDDPQYTGMTYERLGDLFYHERLYKQALKYYQRALPYKMKASQPKYCVWIVRDIAECFRLTGEQDSARANYERAMEQLHLIPEREAASIQTEYATFLHETGCREEASLWMKRLPEALKGIPKDSLFRNDHLQIKELAETNWLSGGTCITPDSHE